GVALESPSFPTRRSSDLEEGVCAGGAVHVVARLRLGLRRYLRRHLEVRDRVHADLAVRQLAEGLGLPPELVVGGRDEVIPAEERDRKSTRLNSSHGSSSY